LNCKDDHAKYFLQEQKTSKIDKKGEVAVAATDPDDVGPNVRRLTGLPITAGCDGAWI
jgi:hypothetical protein